MSFYDIFDIVLYTKTLFVFLFYGWAIGYNEFSFAWNIRLVTIFSIFSLLILQKQRNEIIVIGFVLFNENGARFTNACTDIVQKSNQFREFP